MPGIYSVAICNNSIVLPYDSLAVMSFEIMTRAIVVVACFARCIFSPESEFSSILLIGYFGGVPIQFIKLILGLLITILLMITPKLHLHPF